MNFSKYFYILLCTAIFVLSISTSIAQTGCHTLDWETDCSGNPFPEGLYVPSDAYDCIGVTITNNLDPVNFPLVLFNSAVPTGNDPDLGTPSTNCPSCTSPCPGTSNHPNGGLTNCVPQGLILITEENPIDVAPMDGLEDDPDDHNTTDITFAFAAPVTVSTLDFVDDSQGNITFTYSDNSTNNVSLMGGLDNDVYTQVFNESDVISFTLQLTSSGASSLIDFCYDVPGAPPCDLVAPVLGADVNICAGDDPGPIEVVTGATGGNGTIMYQWQQSLTGCFGFGDIAGATSSTYNPGVLTQSTYFQVVVTTTDGMQVCTEESNCISYIEQNCMGMCTNPVVTAEAIPPSCDNIPLQDDGLLQLNSISVGDRLHWSLGNTFDDMGGANTYTNATNISAVSFPYQFATGQPNPAGTQDYTIRVYNNNNTCFTDHVVTMTEQTCIDFGDLPDTSAGTGPLNYDTDDANGGPSHIIDPDLFIGSSIDGETDGQQDPAANGDGADEDGLSFPSNLDFAPGATINLPIDVTNNTGSTAHYEIWIDWNGDGDFNDAGEMVADLSDNGAGNFGQTTIPITIPANTDINQQVGVRARLSNTNNMTPNGAVASGEVEDYLIMVNCKDPICLPTQFTKN